MGGIKLQAPSGGSVTLEAVDTATDDVVTISKAMFDKLAAIDTKSMATAWVNFDGLPASPTIRDSFNVSHVVKTATGIYEIYFTTPMDNSNYSSSLMVAAGTGGASDNDSLISSQSVAFIKVALVYGATLRDSDLVAVQTFGGKN